MSSDPRYFGTKQGKIVKAIAVDSIHSWRGLQSATKFTERELNYHLYLLFQDNVLEKSHSKYYLIPSLEAKYKEYYKSKPISSTIPEKDLSPEKEKLQLFRNREMLVIGIILILVSTIASISFYQSHSILSSIHHSSPPLSGIDSIPSEPEGSSTPEQPSEPPTQKEPDSTPSPSEPTSSSSPEPSQSPEPAPSPESFSISIEKISICTRVIDGDTIELYTDVKIRLADIDAPEENDPGYESSTSALESRVLNKKVFLDVDGVDRHGRLVCVIYVVSGSRFKNVNYALCNGGYAVIWDHHDNEFDPYSWSMFVSSLDFSRAYDDSGDYSPSESDEVPSWAVYVGSSQSDKYHKLDCYWASQISPGNIVYFRSASDAESKGYQPCQVCLKPSSEESEPPSWAVYVGSKLSDKYHKLTCYWASQIKPENRIYFRSKTDAENSGYKACQVCLKSSDGEDESPPSSKTYVGSKNSDVYHELTCYWAKQIKPENRIYFSSKADAESKGYRPCKVCKP